MKAITRQEVPGIGRPADKREFLNPFPWTFNRGCQDEDGGHGKDR
ncbi:MAG: hypothetical protein WCW53_15545 [Syntrophales bacterium]